MAEEKGKILKLLKLDKLFKNLAEYIETEIELAKLDFKDQSEKTIQNVIQALVVLTFTAIFLVFLSIAISIWLNYILENNYYGYLIVASLYLVVVIVLATDKNKSLGKWIFKKFRDNNE